MPGDHFGHVGFVERGAAHPAKAIEGLLVRSQKDRCREGGLLSCCRQILVGLGVVAHHSLAKLHYGRAGALLFREVPQLHLEQTNTTRCLNEDTIRRQRDWLLGRCGLSAWSSAEQ